MTATSDRRSGSRRRCQPGSADHVCARSSRSRASSGRWSPQKEHLDALLEVVGRAVLVDDPLLGGGEHFLGVREALAHRVGPGQRQHRVQADSLRDRQLGELRAEVGIAGEDGAVGGVDEQLGRDLRARVEQPPRHAHGVVDRQRVTRADLLGEPEAQRPGAQLAQPLADHLAVERMREAHLGASRRRLDDDHPPLLRGDERVRGAERDDLVDAQRLAEREHLQRRPLLVRQVGHALGDELHERPAHRWWARQPPQIGPEDEPPRVERPEHELADVQRVALAALPDPPQRPLLHRPAERRLDELVDGVVAQTIELHAQRARVLPERHDCVRAGLAGPDGSCWTPCPPRSCSI
jgi:hypothetical protein